MDYFLASEIENCPASEALFHIIPVPYEHSVSYGGGTARGPAQILSASSQLERHDQLGGEAWRFGIHTAESLDVGGSVEAFLERLRRQTAASARQNHIPFVLGGEHSLSYGAVMGVVDALGEVGIIQIDAHADLRQEYEGSIWSHACVMKRLYDEGLSLLQLGVRALSLEEMELRRDNPRIHALDARSLCNPPRHCIDVPEDFPQQVYLSVDIDGLDSGLMPATGTPVPGGLGWWQCLDLIADIARQRRIVAMDLVEFAPQDGWHSCDFLAADLAHKMMGIVGRSRS